eukprot:1451779-Pleurochrysis_carterae.AAC.1
MKDGKCNKKFPKPFQQQTCFPDRQPYPTYRRRAPSDGGAAIMTTEYNCHINVEACASVESVKNLYKYIYKGPARAMVNVSDDAHPQRDEVALFQNLRSIGTSESCWRPLGLYLFDHHPAVLRLALHLPGQQRVQFPQGAEYDVARSDPPKTTLTQWLQYVSENCNEAAALTSTYIDFPDEHTYYKSQKTWLHKLGRHEVVGRVRTIHPKQKE